MLRVVVSLFLTGFVLGYGPCMLSCGPILISYVAATKKSGASGLFVYLVFSIVRLLVYLCFGFIAGMFGEYVIRSFLTSRLLVYFDILFGFFLLFLGFVFILKKFDFNGRCAGFFCGNSKAGEIRNILIIALIVSLSPCLPMYAMFGYVALVSDTWFKGVLYAFAFGLGTVFSPLIFFVFAAGWITDIAQRNRIVLKILRFTSAFVIIFLGIILIVHSYLILAG